MRTCPETSRGPVGEARTKGFPGRAVRTGPDCPGAVLLEVVLALVLFVAAAAVVTNSLNSAVNSVERMRLRAEAADLAVTLLSEVELGLRPRLPGPPVPAPPPHTNWTWEIVAGTQPALDAEAAARVEVVVRHLDPPFVHRLAAWLPVAAPAVVPESAPGEGLP